MQSSILFVTLGPSRSLQDLEATAAYDRFTEGFDTADLKTAKALLESLSGSARQPA
jgi:hypothetical protein